MASAIQKFIMDPANHDLLGVVKGARNGIVYGCKVRFPHALVMAALFSHKPWPVRIHGILTATRNHALALGKFVTIYKIMMLIQKRLNGGKERDLDTLIAGGIGGWWVFSDRTPVSTSGTCGKLGPVRAAISPLRSDARAGKCHGGGMEGCADAMAFIAHRIRITLGCSALRWMLRPAVAMSTLQTPARTGYRRALSVFGVGGQEMADIASHDEHEISKQEGADTVRRSTSRLCCTSCLASSSRSFRACTHPRRAPPRAPSSRSRTPSPTSCPPRPTRAPSRPPTFPSPLSRPSRGASSCTSSATGERGCSPVSSTRCATCTATRRRGPTSRPSSGTTSRPRVAPRSVARTETRARSAEKKASKRRAPVSTGKPASPLPTYLTHNHHTAYSDTFTPLLFSHFKSGSDNKGRDRTVS